MTTGEHDGSRGTFGREVRGVLLCALVAAGCSAAAPSPLSTPTSADAMARYRSLYDSGFQRVVASLPPASERPDLWPLHGLARFRSDDVAWAEISDGSFVALEDGDDEGGWLAVVPDDKASGMPATLMMDPSPGVAVVLVRQKPVSQLWAGIFLVHELSHLADRVLHVEPADSSGDVFLAGERRAYELEAKAADTVSKGALTKAMDDLLDTWHPSTLDDVVERGLRMDARELGLLDDTIPAGISQSTNEAGMRKGFFVAALILRQAERWSATEAGILAAIDRLIHGNQP